MMTYARTLFISLSMMGLELYLFNRIMIRKRTVLPMLCLMLTRQLGMNLYISQHLMTITSNALWVTRLLQLCEIIYIPLLLIIITYTYCDNDEGILEKLIAFAVIELMAGSITYLCINFANFLEGRQTIGTLSGSFMLLDLCIPILAWSCCHIVLFVCAPLITRLQNMHVKHRHIITLLIVLFFASNFFTSTTTERIAAVYNFLMCAIVCGVLFLMIARHHRLVTTQSETLMASRALLATSFSSLETHLQTVHTLNEEINTMMMTLAENNYDDERMQDYVASLREAKAHMPVTYASYYLLDAFFQEKAQRYQDAGINWSCDLSGLDLKEMTQGELISLMTILFRYLDALHPTDMAVRMMTVKNQIILTIQSSKTYAPAILDALLKRDTSRLVTVQATKNQMVIAITCTTLKGE